MFRDASVQIDRVLLLIYTLLILHIACTLCLFFIRNSSAVSITSSVFETYEFPLFARDITEERRSVTIVV